MDTERNNRKDNLASDMVELSEMPEFDEYRETIQQISTQTEAPKIQILKYTTEDSRLVEERLKNYDILDPNAWELFVVNQATEALNRYRQKYGNKLPKLKENIKLRIVANETDLSELMGLRGMMEILAALLYLTEKYMWRVDIETTKYRWPILLFMK